MLPLPSNSVLGYRYRILRSLGDGGFGQTFLAEDLKYPLQPQCVVKRLLPQSQNPSLLEITRRLFQKEIEVLKELGKHDRIPELLDSFEENGEFYLVQQYIDGEDLEGKIVGLNESETIHLIREVLEILEFVHGKSVIHRDIKPSNVIRRRHDDKLVVIDFGNLNKIKLRTMMELPPVINRKIHKMVFFNQSCRVNPWR
ncbi:MAG: protein kinase domain-containing protein, partial [Synechococcales cyanobacterium]